MPRNANNSWMPDIQLLLPHSMLGSFNTLKNHVSQEDVWGVKAGLTCPPDSAPAPAEVLARVRRRGEEEEKERRGSGADRQQTWQQHFLRWAILNSLSYLLTPASKCSVGKLGVCYRWLYWGSETWNFWHANKLDWKSLKYEILSSPS